MPYLSDFKSFDTAKPPSQSHKYLQIRSNQMMLFRYLEKACFGAMPKKSMMCFFLPQPFLVENLDNRQLCNQTSEPTVLILAVTILLKCLYLFVYLFICLFIYFQICSISPIRSSLLNICCVCHLLALILGMNAI